MSKLILVRGHPGSGKSTIAETLFPSFLHFEADMFFINQGGVYVFDKDKIKEAHQWCQEMTRKHIKRNFDVIVTNTFTKKWELEPYLCIAKDFNAELYVIKAEGNFQSVHGVPDEVIKRMKDTYES